MNCLGRVFFGARHLAIYSSSLAMVMSIFAIVKPPVVAAATPVPPTCSFSQLEVAVTWGPGAEAGHIGIPFIIVIASKSACTLKGYPRLRLYTAAVNKTSIKVGFNATGGVYGYVKPKLTVIAPHSVASFGMDYVDAMNQQDTNGPSCTAQTVNVYLPVIKNPYGQGYQTVVDFNICYSGFGVTTTSIQSGPIPR